MLLDGSKVAVGDSVYHITLGHGTVLTIEKNTARIKMGKGGGVKNMAEGGISGGAKVFFWGKPVIIAPKKSERELTAKIGSLLRQLLDYTE